MEVANNQVSGHIVDGLVVLETIALAKIGVYDPIGGLLSDAPASPTEALAYTAIKAIPALVYIAAAYLAYDLAKGK